MRLLFIHGLLCNSTDWSGQMSALSELGIEENVAIELPDSDSIGQLGDKSFISYAANLVNQIKRQSQSRKSTILVGHSMGCRIALEAIYQDSQDVAGLILIEGSSRMTENPEEIANNLLRLSKDEISSFIQSAFTAMFSPATPEWFRNSTLERLKNVNHTYAARLLADMTRWDSVQAQKAIQSCQIPILVIQSTVKKGPGQRKSIGEDEMTDWLSSISSNTSSGDVQIVRLKNLGHFPQIEAPGLINEQIKAFIHYLVERKSKLLQK